MSAASGGRLRPLRCAVVIGSWLLLGWYALCALASLLLRMRFTPERPLLYAIFLTAATVAVSLAGIFCPPDSEDFYEAVNRPARYISAALLPSVTAFYLSDVMNLLEPLPAVAVIVLCLAVEWRMSAVCVPDGYFKSISRLATLAVLIFCLFIWLHPLLYPTSETVLSSQRSYSENGQAAVVTQTRVFGRQVRTDVYLYDCTPFSLGFGRFERTYGTRLDSRTAALDASFSPSVTWDGAVLYIDGEEIPYPTD